jgi:transcriptional regulator with XRE-family HTH domain
MAPRSRAPSVAAGAPAKKAAGTAVKQATKQTAKKAVAKQPKKAGPKRAARTPAEDALAPKRPPAEPQADPQPELGNRLRQARREAGLPLTEVAAATQISASFLSMVENGGSDISIGRLLRLAQFYRVSFDDLLPERRSLPAWDVVHKVGRDRIEWVEEGFELEFLADARHPLRPTLARFKPRSGMTEPLRGAGDAFLYLLSGHLTVEFDRGEPALLGPGESVYVPGERSRLYRNPGSRPAVLLSVVLRQDIYDRRRG